MKILNLSKDDVVLEPFPHVIKQNIIDPELYKELARDFPETILKNEKSMIASRTGSGNDIYRGDDQYKYLTEQFNSWWQLDAYINSNKFMNLVIDLFGNFIDESYSPLNSQSMEYTDYVEPREAMSPPQTNLLEKIRFSLGLKPKFEDSVVCNSIFSRLDIHSAMSGYGIPVHCDRANRVISLIIYFCDADETGMVGGNLGIHKHKKAKKLWQYERHPNKDDTELIQTVSPQENLGVFFLCSNHSYHSATTIESIVKPRRFLYINISSKAKQVW